MKTAIGAYLIITAVHFELEYIMCPNLKNALKQAIPFQIFITLLMAGAYLITDGL